MTCQRANVTGGDDVNLFASTEFEIFDMSSGTMSYERFADQSSSAFSLDKLRVAASKLLLVTHYCLAQACEKATCHEPERFPPIRQICDDSRDTVPACRVAAKTLYALNRKVKAKKERPHGPFHVFEFVENVDDPTTKHHSSEATNAVCQVVTKKAL